jgi:hypothetical protein
MNLSASASMIFRASATLSATYEPTGRFITADSDYTLAREWAELRDRSLQERHKARDRFVTCLARVPRLNVGATLLCFRGRRFADGHSPASEEMGPPPVARANRYNRPDESVLYLCESQSAIANEPIAGDGPLWVQSFVLAADQLVIADFSLLGVDDFASKTFWFAELAGNDGVPVEFSFSQLIASLVAQHFDGMRVPGVRGNQDTRYSNVVIFRAETRWKQWLVDGSPPTKVTPDGFA